MKEYNVFVLIGDGECYEGSTWESINYAANLKLDNLCVVIDRNKQITLDATEDCNKLEPLAKKWESFGWREWTIDGHSFEQLRRAFDIFKNKGTQNRPMVIIAETIKGKGVSFMEGQVKWHHGMPNKEEYERAKAELNGS